MNPTEVLRNAYGQPITNEMDWRGCSKLPMRELRGNYCRLIPLSLAVHGEALLESLCATENRSAWTYLPYGPFVEREGFFKWLEAMEGKDDPLFFAVCDEQGKAIGLTAFLRVNYEHGTIEIGHLNFGPTMRRSRVSTEAIYLLMKVAFEHGFRRCEWKCDSLNAPSRHAATRLGFKFEGIFRNSMMNKGRNRDTAWFSIIDTEWPSLDRAFRDWLDASNFFSNELQKKRLGELVAQRAQENAGAL